MAVSLRLNAVTASVFPHDLFTSCRRITLTPCVIVITKSLFILAFYDGYVVRVAHVDKACLLMIQQPILSAFSPPPLL